MRLTPKLMFCIAIILPSLTAIPSKTEAEEKSEPQMVWVTHTEGAVKFSVGHKGKPELGKDWLEVAAGQVMENGYTLVTEEGRAEIEFEDGTVVYLAPKSALVFNWLRAQGDETESEMTLLTGKATVAHESTNEMDLGTPSGKMIRLVSKRVSTVESTLDGMVLEAVGGERTVNEGSEINELAPGHAIAVRNGSDAVSIEERPRTAENIEWDQWTAARLAKHRELVAEGMKETGLDEPIPGLAGMAEAGEFYDCAPYGRCWKPNEESQVRGVAGSRVVAKVALPTAQARSGGAAQAPRPTIFVNNTMLMRCPMQVWQQRAGGATKTKPRKVQYGTCMGGSWANWGSGNPCADASQWPLEYWNCVEYPTWVSDQRHHHHHSCHIVKTGHRGIGIVPIHPLDKKGHQPLNARAGVLTLAVEKGKLEAGVKAVGYGGVHVIATEPKSVVSTVERNSFANTTRVGLPVIEARMMGTPGPHATGSPVEKESPSSGMYRYDFKSGNFLSHGGVAAGRAESHGMPAVHAGSGGVVSNAGHGGGFGGGSVHASLNGSGGGGASHGGSSGGSSVSGGGGGGSSHGGGGGSAASSGGGASAAGGGGGGSHH